MKEHPFSSGALLPCLAAWPVPRRYVVLASGGLDSTVLLRALAEVAPQLPAPTAVLHFNHGLAAESAEWARRVEAMARSVSFCFYCERLEIATGGALETRAREIRYRRLGAWMRAGDCCLLAHHADDQAETFVLQALRGAGPAGLAAMPPLARFGPGWLGRPLLAWSRAEVAHWARERGLSWVEDPGNRDSSASRNWLRHQVLPLIRDRWPAATRTLVRSAELAAESSRLMAEIADQDLQTLGGAATGRLAVASLSGFSFERRRNLLRHWLRSRGLPVPGAAKLAELERTLLARDPGPHALIVWPGAEARHFRGMLHVDAPLPPAPNRPVPLQVGRWADLGPIGRLGLVAKPGGSLSASIAERRLELRFRAGGERIRPLGQSHRRRVKTLLQEEGVLPWLRAYIPFLYADDRLVAVAGIAVSEDYSGRGLSLIWQNSPALR